jgi:hypothetical protein
VKLNLDPMPALRAVAVAKINATFNTQAQPHVDAAHDAKRKAAASGAPYPDWFTAEAALRGITPEALAALIASKPDNVGARELSRQQALAAIAAAKTPADLDAIVKGNQ